MEFIITIFEIVRRLGGSLLALALFLYRRRDLVSISLPAKRL
jgi:hypothetical protein